MGANILAWNHINPETGKVVITVAYDGEFIAI